MKSNDLDILIVDDQAGVRYLLELLVKESGHRAHTAQNGLEAIEFVKTNRPDLVFMDVQMPLMNGLEALARIRVISPNTGVIIMTAYCSEDTVMRAEEEGAQCCIAKPFDMDKIKELLEDIRLVRDNSDDGNQLDQLA